jgi:oligopeptide transport system ATP-binding protein
MEIQNLLQVEGLEVSFFTKREIFKAVDGVSFGLQAGKTLAIIGESGCGKSVAAMSILQLVADPPGKIVGGDISFKGEHLLDKDENAMCKLRGKEISMIFQEPMTSLNPVVRIGDQIAEVLLLHQDTNGEVGKLSKWGKKARAMLRVVELLDLVGIPDASQRAKDYSYQLSGGMRQRVMIAMALACNPDLLIADEPTTALDVTVQAQILDLLRRLQQDFNTAIILITHDFGVVAEMADEVLVMYAGQVVEKAAVANIFARPLHPYTIGLLKSIPRLDKEQQTLYVILGVVPNSAHYPKGCRFAPRCPRANSLCRQKLPELREIAPNRQVRCHYAEVKRHE